MKNSQFIRVITSIGILLLVSGYHRVSAQSNIDYYYNVLKEEFEIRAQRITDFLPNKSDTSAQMKGNNYLLTTTSELIKASELSTFLSNKQSTIIICDADFQTSASINFSCTNNDVTSEQFSKIGDIYQYDCSSCAPIYIIPENVLVSPNKRSNAIELFRAFRLSSKSTSDTNSETAIITPDVSLLQSLNPILIEVTILAILTLVFLFMFSSYKFDHFCISYKNSVKDTIRNIVDCLSQFFLRYQQLLVYVVIILSIIYLPIISLLSLRDGQGINIGYFIDYSLDALKPARMIGYIEDHNYIRIFLFFYNYLYGSLLFLLILPYLLKSFSNSLGNLPNVHIKKAYTVVGVPSLVFSILFIVITTNIHQTGYFLLTLLFVLTVLVFQELKSHSSVIYTVQQQKLLLVLLLGVIVLSLSIKMLLPTAVTPRKYESLIGVSNEIITLPYKKEVKENLRYKDYIVNTDNPIFVNEYLISASKYDYYTNKSLDQFSGDGDYIIQHASPSEVIKFINANQKVKDILTNTAPSVLFSIEKDSLEDVSQKYQLEIEFSCKNLKIADNLLLADIIYLTSDNTIEKKEYSLMYIPGCPFPNTPNTYKTELDFPYSGSSQFYIHMKNISDADINSIVLSRGSSLIKPRYIKFSNSNDPIVISQSENPSVKTLTNYIFNNEVSALDSNSTDSPQNISLPINKLLDEGKLRNSFVIWTLEKNHIIKD